MSDTPHINYPDAEAAQRLALSMTAAVMDGDAEGSVQFLKGLEGAEWVALAVALSRLAADAITHSCLLDTQRRLGILLTVPQAAVVARETVRAMVVGSENYVAPTDLRERLLGPEGS